MYAADCGRALDALGPKLVQLYGQGEAPMTITGVPREVFTDRAHPRYMARLGSGGIARTGVEVRVVDEADNDVISLEHQESPWGPVMTEAFREWAKTAIG